MTDKKTLYVAAWSRPVIPERPGKHGKFKSASPVGIGVVGTLLIHALVLQSVLQKIRPPPLEGPGASSTQSMLTPVESLVLIDLPSSNSRALFEEIASAGLAPKNPLVTVISADPLPNLAIPQDEQTDARDLTSRVDSADPAARAILFGRYTGQIDARIERIWRRPRSRVTTRSLLRQASIQEPNNDVISDDTFRCQVRIIQDVHGSIQEVQLLSCNGSVDWQHSLVVAILAASPLPAPPSLTVFTHALTMTFTGFPYGPSSAADDYALASTANALSNVGNQ